MVKITFQQHSDFFTTLKKKVKEYFDTHELNHYGDYKLHLKAAILLVSAATIYTILVFFTPPVWIAVILCALLGFNLAGIGFNIMHDAAHGSFSLKKWVNELMSYSLNIIGGNVYLWKAKHNINHHTYTNIDGMDDDIDIEPWIRVHPSQPLHWYHRFQYIYWVILYGATYMLWVFVGDFVKYFSGKVAEREFHKMNFKEHVIFWVSKMIYLSLFFIIPIFKVGLLETLVGYLIMAFLCGFVIAIVFQLAHLTTGSHMPVLSGKTEKIEEEWAIFQVRTTADFAVKNKFITWCFGGLNFQVEHHLFPKISHIHYPQLNKILIETCKEFNIKYHSYSSLAGAISSHVAYLKETGRK